MLMSGALAVGVCAKAAAVAASSALATAMAAKRLIMGGSVTEKATIASCGS
jgi:hypothetical protein